MQGFSKTGMGMWDQGPRYPYPAGPVEYDRKFEHFFGRNRGNTA